MDFYDLKPHQVFLVSQKALIVEQDKLLLLQLDDGRWELPGGLLDFGEDMQAGLLREVEEETGLTVEVSRVIGASQFQAEKFMLRDERVVTANFILIGFICFLTGGDFRLSHEHKAYQWANREDVQSLTFAPNSQFAIDRYLEGL